MPIEIKELHIKINVEERPGTTGSLNPEKEQKQEIIAACVEQVMEILSKKEER
ncbi:MAG TPA: DUF5908 family protein [Prolixibacteraceae bacterium]|nr:DUF5908 family protein [Prolixibacteraceae bacterium]HPS12547.1 DUF5908 family protein [Prolixibacteraceae bacterium]